MAFNRRIMQKLEEACEGNEAMLGYMRDIVGYEMRDAGRYTEKYEEYLRRWSKRESEGDE